MVASQEYYMLYCSPEHRTPIRSSRRRQLYTGSCTICPMHCEVCMPGRRVLVVECIRRAVEEAEATADQLDQLAPFLQYSAQPSSTYMYCISVILNWAAAVLLMFDCYSFLSAHYALSRSRLSFYIHFSNFDYTSVALPRSRLHFSELLEELQPISSWDSLIATLGITV